MKTFAARYATCIEGEWVHPSYVYKVSVVMFAAALIRYRTLTDNTAETVSAADLKEAIYEHLAENHPELVPAVQKAEQDEHEGWLAWSGPDIRIKRRDLAERDWAAEGIQERRQYSGNAIYL